MAADVTLRFEGQAGNTQQVLTALEKKVEKLGNKLQAASRKGSRGAKSMQKDMRKTGSQFLKTSLAAVGIGAALTLAVRKVKELRQEAERTAIALEKSAKKLQIQAGLTDLQSEKAQQRTAALAQKTGFGVLAIDRINTELVSQGFNKPLQTGASAAFISFLQASNQAEDADLEEFVSAFSKELLAGGKQKTGKNLLALALRARGLFKSTPFQAPDLAELSKARAIAKQVGVTEEQFLSAGTILKEKLPAAESATGLRNVLLRIGAPEKTGLKALKKAGVDPKSIDLIGETLPQALKTLGAALQALPGEEKLRFLKDIFGQKVAVPALALIEGAQAGKFEKFAEFQRDREGFEKAVRVARRGVGPGIAKSKAEVGELQRKRILSGGLTEQEAVEVQKVRFERIVSKFPGSEFELSIAETLIMGLPRALNLSRFTMPRSLREEAFRNRQSEFSLEKLEEKTDKTNELLEEQNELMKQNGNGNGKVIDRHAHR